MRKWAAVIVALALVASAAVIWWAVQPTTITVSGRVLSSGTHQPEIAATVTVGPSNGIWNVNPPMPVSTTTNGTGYFSVTMPQVQGAPGYYIGVFGQVINGCTVTVRSDKSTFTTIYVTLSQWPTIGSGPCPPI